MRKIELKEYDNSNYRADLKQIISTPGREPYNLSQLRAAVKVIDKLDDAEDGFLLLEESEFDFVKRRVESAQFVRADKTILQFIDDIIDAPEVEVKSV